ncbi:MAG: cadherin repeat domain-containing protein, partial [Chloroflexi bacterium]|nr:cadherin repeat domain-containing protein [Chloroflexota bacterium]
MSLAQLFYLKENVRQRVRQWKAQHRAWRKRTWRSPRQRARSFSIEPLESRVLLSATPVEIDFEPGFVQAGAVNVEPGFLNAADSPPSPHGNTLQVAGGSQTPISLQLDYVDAGAAGAFVDGFGMRVHFNSLLLQADPDFATSVLATTIQAAPPAVQDDTGNFDNDDSTDKYINFGWGSTSPAFPTGPEVLAVLNWTTTTAFTSGTTNINITASALADGTSGGRSVTGDFNAVAATITANGSLDFPLVLNNQTFNIAENSPIGTLVGAVVTTDPEFNDIAFLTRIGALDPAFTFDEGTGQVTVADPSRLDFEAGPFRSTQFVVEALRFADFITDQGLMTINVTDVPESVFNPVVPGGQIFTVPENSLLGTIVGTPTVTDQDGAFETFTYTESGVGTGNSLFQINLTTGQITVSSGATLNFEGTNSYTYTFTVTDSGGLTGNGSVTINLTNVNEAPVITTPPVSPPTTITVTENTISTFQVVASDPDNPGAGQTLSYVLSNTAAAFSTISSTGLITFNALETNGGPSPGALFALTITVSDNGTPVQSATRTIAVRVLEDNKAPVLAPIGPKSVQIGGSELNFVI